MLPVNLRRTVVAVFVVSALVAVQIAYPSEARGDGLLWDAASSAVTLGEIVVDHGTIDVEATLETLRMADLDALAEEYPDIDIVASVESAISELETLDTPTLEYVVVDLDGMEYLNAASYSVLWSWWNPCSWSNFARNACRKIAGGSRWVYRSLIRPYTCFQAGLLGFTVTSNVGILVGLSSGSIPGLLIAGGIGIAGGMWVGRSVSRWVCSRI